MTTSDYLINALFIGLVIIQMRGKRLTAFTFLMPFAVVVGVGSRYLHGIPTAGNDLVLAVIGALVGAGLGIACAMTTAVYKDNDGKPFAKAGPVAAALWIVGIGARLAFSFYVTHGGSEAIGNFSVAHHITSGQAWITCLILMAFGEVTGRTGALYMRSRKLSHVSAPAEQQCQLPAVPRAMMVGRES
jgi:hypothetical protein